MSELPKRERGTAGGTIRVGDLLSKRANRLHPADVADEQIVGQSLVGAVAGQTVEYAPFHRDESPIPYDHQLWKRYLQEKRAFIPAEWDSLIVYAQALATRQIGGIAHLAYSLLVERLEAERKEAGQS